MKFSRIIKKLGVVFFGLVLLVAPTVASAQLGGQFEPKNPTVQQFKDVPTTVSRGFDIVIVVSGIIFVVLLLLGGVLYLVSAGNEDQSKKARQLILDAVIGLIIVATAWAVGNFVLQQLGIRGDTLGRGGGIGLEMPASKLLKS